MESGKGPATSRQVHAIWSKEQKEVPMAGVVVVIEDEMKLRDLIRAFLEREGFTVLTAATAAEGLQFEAKVMPDLVVLDLGLPDIPGEEVAREL